MSVTEAELLQIEDDMQAVRSASDEATLRRKVFALLVDCRCMIAELRGNAPLVAALILWREKLWKWALYPPGAYWPAIPNEWLMRHQVSGVKTHDTTIEGVIQKALALEEASNAE